MDEIPAYPRIPYGEADFRRIRLNGWLYVDKTRFLRRLERERYVLLIRPRRFGKTLWVSLLENYYDRFWADDFDASFAGTGYDSWVWRWCSTAGSWRSATRWRSRRATRIDGRRRCRTDRLRRLELDVLPHPEPRRAPLVRPGCRPTPTAR